MPYIGPDTSRTDRACEKCKHFGGWSAGVGYSVWCLDGKVVHALSYSGCAYFRAWAMMPANAVEPEEKWPQSDGSDGQ